MTFKSIVLAVSALVLSTSVNAALINVGINAFSGSQTTLDFEDTAGNGVALPSGYGSTSGVTFTSETRSYAYTAYGTVLANAAIAAGLSDRAATWGGGGSLGSGFSLTDAQTRVGFYISSNVGINTSISAYLGGNLLGSQTLILNGNEIGFVGFEDIAGIDQIIIGDNFSCSGCVHQLDAVMFETVVPVPAAVWLFGSGLIGLTGMARRKKTV